MEYRVKRVLCEAQYGDILLCEVPTGMKSADHTSPTVLDSGEIDLVVVKQISRSLVHARQESKGDGGKRMMQLSDDPMIEVDVAARICAAGNHKNIVRYYNALHDDHESFGIVMEYCNEGDLLKRLDQLPGNRLVESEALAVLRQIASGLLFLHDVVGVAHRDVSLENVMIHNGVCKLGDFGLSARIKEESCGGQSLRRAVQGRVGKLGYMAPEVASGQAYDPVMADVWSLGIVFFILLTGSPLVEMASFESPTFRAFSRLGLRRVLMDWNMTDDFCDETIALADRMLQIDPCDRISIRGILSHPVFDTVGVV